MRREQLPKSARTFVMPRWHVMYVSVNKAASTSLKWMVADIQGERPEQFYRSRSAEVSRTMTIHQRRMWTRTPTASSLAEAELMRISTAEGWFIWGVVRHPVARLFSAWQSKLLLREAPFVRKYGDAAGFPRVPRTGDDIVDDFSRFVLTMAEEGHPVMRDRHFRRQYGLLAPDRIPYSRIYRTSEIGQLLRDLEAHLRARGYGGAPLELRHVNETPLPAVPSLFPPEVRRACRRIYARDFSAFGYSDETPAMAGSADSYTERQVAEIRRLVERAERIGDLSAIAKRNRPKSLTPCRLR